MFNINGIEWQLKFVPSNYEALIRSNKTKTVGVCDNNTHTIYIDNDINGFLLKRVICHELTHAAMFSYGIDLSIEQEELFAKDCKQDSV